MGSSSVGGAGASPDIHSHYAGGHESNGRESDDDAATVAEDEVPSAGGGVASPTITPKGDRRRQQGGSHQKPAQDLYTTNLKTITPLIEVLQARHPDSQIWEPCLGLGNIAEPLAEAGFSVIGTDLFTPLDDGTFSKNPSQSFVDCEICTVGCAKKKKECTHKQDSFTECALPEGFDPAKDIIVTNPPFSLKLKFIERFYKLGVPTYCILPIDSVYGNKGCVKLLAEHGVEMFYLAGGTASSSFYKVSEKQDKSIGTCAWFAFNTRNEAKEKNVSFFLDEA
jgi:hypothetical protein